MITSAILKCIFRHHRKRKQSHRRVHYCLHIVIDIHIELCISHLIYGAFCGVILVYIILDQLAAAQRNDLGAKLEQLREMFC
jgi:hypothetical protein